MRYRIMFNSVDGSGYEDLEYTDKEAAIEAAKALQRSADLDGNGNDLCYRYKVGQYYDSGIVICIHRTVSAPPFKVVLSGKNERTIRYPDGRLEKQSWTAERAWEAVVSEVVS